jgi:hypothetical protein
MQDFKQDFIYLAVWIGCFALVLFVLYGFNYPGSGAVLGAIAATAVVGLIHYVRSGK